MKKEKKNEMSAAVEDEAPEGFVEVEDDETTSPSSTLPASVLDPAVVEACKLRSAEDIRNIDDIVAVSAQRLFFGNDVAKAEEMLRAGRFKDPLAASGFGVIGTVRALLSTEQTDVNEGCERLLFAASFGRAVLPPERSVVGKTVSAVTGAASWLFRSVTKKEAPAVPTMTAAEFRAHVIVAEAETLRATLLLLQESLTGYIKAGFALRRSYNIYDKLQNYIESKKKELGIQRDDEVVTDRNSLYGMYFGLGCIHVVTSILPPKVLTLLKALGYMHDRTKGFTYLMAALESDTLRSPLASLFMLAHHGLLPSFATLLTDESVPFAKKVLAQTLEMYPVSLIHLWLAGRVQRLERNVPASIETYKRCMAVSLASSLHELLPQLHHFALYDLGWSYCIQLRWAEAAEVFHELERGSNWSKKAYAYAYGVCIEMLALEQCAGSGDQPLSSEKKDELTAIASDAFKRALRHTPIKLGGRIISIDQFVNRRLQGVKRLALANAGVASASSPTGLEGATSPLYANDPAYYDSDDAELPPGLILSNAGINPLCGLHLLILFNMHPQMEDAPLRTVAISTLDALVKIVPRTVLHDALGVESQAKLAVASAHVTTALDQAAVLCILRANSLHALGEVDEAEKIYKALEDQGVTSGLKHEKWVGPYAFYEHGVLLYRHRRMPQLCAEKFKEMRQRFGSMDYNFEMQMQFRLHLTQHVLGGAH